MVAIKSCFTILAAALISYASATKCRVIAGMYSSAGYSDSHNAYATLEFKDSEEVIDTHDTEKYAVDKKKFVLGAKDPVTLQPNGKISHPFRLRTTVTYPVEIT